jgi:hypothetical protein
MECDPAKVRVQLEALIRHVRASRPDLMEALLKDHTMTDEIKEGLGEQIRKFNNPAL